MALTHRGSPDLKTSRVLLRPARLSDAEDMFASCHSAELVTRFISIPTHSSVEDTVAMLEKKVAAYEKPDHYYWLCVPKDKGSASGAFMAFNVDERSHKCEVGYYLSRDCWGRGLASETLAAMIDFLFAQVGFRRLEARCDVANVASARVLEKCGFSREGCLRQSFCNNYGHYVDSFFFGLLRQEWQ